MTKTEKTSPAAGFEDTYRDHRVALLRLAYLFSGSRHVSEDVVQSVFTTAHDRWDQIDDPLPYLKRAVVNRVKDGQRRHFRRASLDGRWLSIDGRVLFKATVAASET